ncbi:hypothetical protein ACIP1U_32600 [Cupriavidus sp. NPDC089707]|uniref:hypothetical protein n=1 Tax=Cupriavidus sp. NPDC089707 TaxID=3363963 RepID=UPI0037F1BE83
MQWLLVDLQKQPLEIKRVTIDQWIATGKQGALQLAAMRQRFADDLKSRIAS